MRMVARASGLLLLAGMLGIAVACSKGEPTSTDTVDTVDGGATSDGAGPEFTGLGGLDPACVTARASTDLRPAYIMFVVDGSGSMANFKKWRALTDALTALFDQMATKADPAFGVGMIVYADAADPTTSTDKKSYGPYPTSKDLPILVVDKAHASALTARLAPGPGGLTPTQPALEGAYKALEAYSPTPPLAANGLKHVVLVTDGVPFADVDGDGQLDDATQVTASLKMAAERLASAPPAGPISTFVVGVGEFPPFDLTEYDPTFLGRLSVAGGTRSSPQCNPTEEINASAVCHFQINPGDQKTALQLQQELALALDKIRRQALACEFTIGTPTGRSVIDPTRLNVVYTPTGGSDAVVPQSATDGWRYDDPKNPTRVILTGKVCEDYRDARGTIDVFLGCTTVLR